MSLKPRNASEEYLEESDPVSATLDRLDIARYHVEQGIIRPIRDDQQMTQDEWEAINYLLNDWTFFYEPEEDLIKATTQFYGKATDTAAYVWEG